MESLPFDLGELSGAGLAHLHRKPDLQLRSELEAWAAEHPTPQTRGLDHHSGKSLWDFPRRHRWRESWYSIPLGCVQSLGRRWGVFLSTGAVLMGFNDCGIDSGILVIDIVS